jgi:hypothetical protein
LAYVKHCHLVSLFDIPRNEFQGWRIPKVRTAHRNLDPKLIIPRQLDPPSEATMIGLQSRK